MNSQILLVVGLGIVSSLLFAIGYGVIDWAKKGENPGGERDEKMKAKSRRIGVITLILFVIQLLQSTGS